MTESYGNTWDGIAITPGLIVFTNEMRVGKVVGGSLREHSPGWFDVQYRDGSKVMQNAERVATHFEDRQAAKEYAEGHDWKWVSGEGKCTLCGVEHNGENTRSTKSRCPKAGE